MPMTGFPRVDRQSSNVVHCIRKRITFNNPGTTVALQIGVLPVGAIVVGGGAQVITLFNGSTTDLLDIGTTVDADEYASALDVASVGFKAMDDLAAHTGHSETLERTLTATYTDSGGGATTGVADIIVLFTHGKAITS